MTASKQSAGDEVFKPCQTDDDFRLMLENLLLQEAEKDGNKLYRLGIGDYFIMKE